MSVEGLLSWCAGRRPPKAAIEFRGGSRSGLSQRLEVITGPCYNWVEGTTILRQARPGKGDNRSQRCWARLESRLDSPRRAVHDSVRT